MKTETSRKKLQRMDSMEIYSLANSSNANITPSFSMNITPEDSNFTSNNDTSDKKIK